MLGLPLVVDKQTERDRAHGEREDADGGERREVERCEQCPDIRPDYPADAQRDESPDDDA